jgi:ornithine carbamoyltransferase
VLYIGAWNNTAASLVLAVSKLPGMTVTVATPENFAPDTAQINTARRNASESGAVVEVTHDVSMLQPHAADVIYTVRWQSMGEELADPDWRSSFHGFEVTSDLFRSLAREGAIFMHDLPAHRGLEVDAQVIDGPPNPAPGVQQNDLGDVRFGKVPASAAPAGLQRGRLDWKTEKEISDDGKPVHRRRGGTK